MQNITLSHVFIYMFIAMFLSINFELNWIQIFVNFNYAPNVELNFRLVTNYYVIPNISVNVELLNVRSFSVFIVVVVIMIATNIISISTNNTIPTSQPSSSSETVASHHIYVFRGGVMQWVARLGRNLSAVSSSSFKVYRCYIEPNTSPTLLSTGWF